MELIEYLVYGICVIAGALLISWPASLFGTDIEKPKEVYKNDRKPD